MMRPELNHERPYTVRVRAELGAAGGHRILVTVRSETFDVGVWPGCDGQIGAGAVAQRLRKMLDRLAPHLGDVPIAAVARWLRASAAAALAHDEDWACNAIDEAICKAEGVDKDPADEAIAVRTEELRREWGMYAVPFAEYLP